MAHCFFACLVQLPPLGPLQVVPHMAAAGSGRLVNMASVKGLSAVPYDACYCATKAALVSLSDAMRLEMKPLGIKVR